MPVTINIDGNKWNYLLSKLLIYSTCARYPDVDEHSLPMVLKALSPSKRSVVPLLEKATANIWTDLTPDGVEACLNSLSRLRVYNNNLLVHFGTLVFSHILFLLELGDWWKCKRMINLYMAIFQVHSLVIGRIGSHLTSLIFGVEVFRLGCKVFQGPKTI